LRNEEKKIVLITRKSRLDELIYRFNTLSQARFYVEHLGGDFRDYIDEHRTYEEVIRQAVAILSSLGRVTQLDRAYLPNYIFGRDDTIVVIGQDGLVANTIKYLDSHPLIAINPDPARWDGNLLPFLVDDLAEIIPQVWYSQCSRRDITLAKVSLNTGEELYGVNDIFIGPRTHLSLRYNISHGGASENQSSSGIIVSTGLGSTGWFRSLMVGARGVAQSWERSSGGTVTMTEPPEQGNDYSFPWDANYLYFTVREPFPSQYSQTDLLFGRISPDAPLTISSYMPENGVIFSDGIEKDYINFNSGTVATIGVAQKKGCLVLGS